MATNILPTIVLTLLITTSSSVQSLRILGLFPHPGLSHFHFFHPIMRALADAGHDVVVVSHFPDKNSPDNYEDLRLPMTDMLMNSVDLEVFAHRMPLQYFLEMFKITDWGMEACELTLSSPAIRHVLNDKEPFDVILMEQFNADCMMGVAWKLEAPVIGMSSCVLMPWHYDRVGSPLITSYMPSLFAGESEKMSYFGRLNNWLATHVMKLMYNYIILPQNDAITRKYLKDNDMPHIRELVKNTSLLFVNSHYSFEGSRPYTPTIIELGGIHIKEASPLDAEIKEILDSAKDGVIYVSWGSMIRAETLPEDKRTSLLKAFGSFRQTVLWKWENSTLSNQPKNVHIRKWMQQRDILCHPNVRVFVSHGGLMGSSESVYCGVPMVLTPMYGDQFHNAAAARARGIGSIVHYEDITQDSMTAAISEVLMRKTQEKAKQVANSYRNRPRSPNETAIWWVEYVAATRGAPLLKPDLNHLNAISYYSFDIYATIITILLIIATAWYYIILKCLEKLNAKQKQLQQQQQQQKQKLSDKKFKRR